MRKTAIIAAAMPAAIATGAASCSKESIEAPYQEIMIQGREQESGGKATPKIITLAAGNESSLSQIKKTAYASGTHDIIWQESDNFTVFPQGEKDGAEFTVSSISGDGITCTLTGECDEAEGYFATYPYISDATYENGKFTNLVIPTSQKVASADQFDPSADIMVAYTSSASNSLAFRHIGSKLGITVPMSSVYKIEITCSENIAGTACVKLGADPDAIPTIESVTNASKKITLLSPSRMEPFAKGSTYYACILPTTGKSDIKIKFTIGNVPSRARYNLFQGKIGAMERAHCNMAEPPEDKATVLYTKTSIWEGIENITNATKIVFDKLSDDIISGKEKVTLTSDKPGISVYKDPETNNYYLLSEKPIYMEGSLEQMFSSTTRHYLKSVELKNINIENADIAGMFVPPSITNLQHQTSYHDSDIENIDLSGLDFTNVTSMNRMFFLNDKLKNIIWPKDFNTESVTSMNSMFFYCESLESIDLSGFNTANVADMTDMFSGCTGLKTIKASSNFDASAVEKSENMFLDCKSLPDYDESKVDASMAKSTSNGGYLTIE